MDVTQPFQNFDFHWKISDYEYLPPIANILTVETEEYYKVINDKAH